MKNIFLQVMKIVIFTSILTIQTVPISVATSFLKKGYIANDEGKKCWYKQEIKKDVVFFTKKLPEDIRILTFDDPNCMSDRGIGLDVNKRQINFIITKPYSHDDANFQVNVSQLGSHSLFQIRGKCIQSKKYSNVIVSVEYTVINNSITKVVHGSGIAPCK